MVRFIYIIQVYQGWVYIYNIGLLRLGLYICHRFTKVWCVYIYYRFIKVRFIYIIYVF